MQLHIVTGMLLGSAGEVLGLASEGLAQEEPPSMAELLMSVTGMPF
ncbi:MAG TPA: hypothetical protein VNO81_08930 [Candidatus Nitrosotenuis sp.]|nr:hypothetical protein [Candidatus Nitrosotenuis sp.]